MKRARPAASIQEWVACNVAVAVKKATESKKIASLEHDLSIVRKQLIFYKEERNDLEKDLRRYENDFLKTLSDLRPCNNCGRYWSTTDLFYCEHGCEEIKCENCVAVEECAQCGQSICADCLSYCEEKYCRTKLCPACVDNNTDCDHRMCNIHNSPCSKCPDSNSEK